MQDSDGMTAQEQSTTQQAASQTQEKAQEVAGQAQEKVQEVAGQAKEQAQQAAGQVTEQVRSQVDQRSTQAGEQISRQAGDVRAVAEQLREQGKDGPARIAEQAADRAERLGSYLRGSDGDRILGDVESFARRRPWAVVAGGIGLGFMASRFLKASQSDRYRSGASGRADGGTRRTAEHQLPSGVGTESRTGAPMTPSGHGMPAPAPVPPTTPMGGVG